MSDQKTAPSGQGNIALTTKTETRGKYFCFTSYSETKPIYYETDMLYLCFAPEKCPTTGRHHWQGYVIFKNKKTLKGAANYWKKAHGWACTMIIARGDPYENKQYISGPYEKDGKTKDINMYFEEYGNMPVGRGSRTDLKEITNKILDNKLSIENILTDDPLCFHQYGRTLERVEDMKLLKNKRTSMTKGLWLYGPTGTGKSHRAFEIAENAKSYYVHPDDGDWWDNYNQEDIVIVNDFRGNIKYSLLLQLVDKYPVSVRRRCRKPIPFTSSMLIITSSLPPEMVYKNNDIVDSIDQIYRRFDVRELTEKYQG